MTWLRSSPVTLSVTLTLRDSSPFSLPEAMVEALQERARPESSTVEDWDRELRLGAGEDVVRAGQAGALLRVADGTQEAQHVGDLHARPDEHGPVVLEVMFDLTGEQFSGGIEARKWLSKNKAQVDAQVKAVEKTAGEQAQQAADLKKRR